MQAAARRYDGSPEDDCFGSAPERAISAAACAEHCSYDEHCDASLRPLAGLWKVVLWVQGKTSRPLGVFDTVL